MATEVRRRVPSRDRFWRPEDFDGSPDAVAQALSRLVRIGDLRLIRRALHWRGRSTRLGMAPPPPGRLACEVVGDTGTGPSGRSAALALGLSTQVPRQEAIAVPGRAPRSPGPVHDASRGASAKRRDERLRPVEVAVLEVLRDWSGLVEMPTEDAVNRIARLVDSGAIRLDRLARASKTESPRVRERLRRLLIALDRPEIVHVIRPARSEAVRHDLALVG